MFRATVRATTVIDRVSNFRSGHKKGGRIAEFGHKWGEDLGSEPHAHPHPIIPGEPQPGADTLYIPQRVLPSLVTARLSCSEMAAKNNVYNYNGMLNGVI